ncbi:MAG: UDP-N-acetylmuramate dehydrogenase [Patescibacteria group bacterium]
MSIESKIQKNIPLAPFTTFKIGGPAKFLIELKSKEELADAFQWAKKEKQKVFILAGGSNIIVNDKGIDGLVLKMNNDQIIVRGDRLDCGAGASLARAVTMAASNSLAGLEWASGIPRATIGGAVRGNAGAFGTSMSEIIETVEVFNLKRKKFEIFSNKDCKLNYRESIFKENDNFIIWAVVLKMSRVKASEINKKIDECMGFRNKKQPKLPSAGSVFKNLSVANLREFNTNLADLAEDEGRVKRGKIGAGWLIELADLKGKTIGGAKVSLEHANFIINTGKATAGDVVTLISYIKQRVRNRFKVQLQEEVQYLGY